MLAFKMSSGLAHGMCFLNLLSEIMLLMIFFQRGTVCSSCRCWTALTSKLVAALTSYNKNLLAHTRSFIQLANNQITLSLTKSYKFL